MSGTPPGAAGRPELRRSLRQRRREAMAAAHGPLLQILRRELPPRLPAGRHLGLFWPLGGEPDLRPLAAGLSVPLALPAIHPWDGGSAPGVNGGQRLVYLPWRPGQPLAPDGCGIPAPPAAPPLAADDLGLLLVPALAIDRHGLRLGSGGGWYDRLRADPAWRAVPALAVLPAACLLPALAAEPWDIPFDGWIDEQGLHRATAATAS
jgi:5-formyltetrahydrofolate cyclo-ligase